MTAPDAEAIDPAMDDRLSFADHPYRRYRLRRTNGDWWVIRRRAGGVLLRALITTAIPRGLPDTDNALPTDLGCGSVGVSQPDRTGRSCQADQENREAP
jgi:hypothetical protein